MDRTLQSILRQAIVEIMALRQENTLLRAKVDTFDSMMRVFNADAPRQGYTHREDICSELERGINKLDEDEKEEA